MTRAIITGMNGAVAPAVAGYLASKGVEVTRWDRGQVPIDDRDGMTRFIGEERPDWFLHIATGPPEWAGAVAGICGERGVKFLFTSSVSVFSEQGTGPYHRDSTPNATDDYGRYKIDCERRVTAANSQAYVARLGWQIGDGPGSNNMIDYLEKSMATSGKVEASKLWWPSCSFLEHTAESLHELLARHPPGLYLINGNRGASFYDIASAINLARGGAWNIVEGDQPRRDDRMIDGRIVTRPLSEKLQGLA